MCFKLFNTLLKKKKKRSYLNQMEPLIRPVSVRLIHTVADLQRLLSYKQTSVTDTFQRSQCREQENSRVLRTFAVSNSSQIHPANAFVFKKKKSLQETILFSENFSLSSYVTATEYLRDSLCKTSSDFVSIIMSLLFTFHCTTLEAPLSSYLDILKEHRNIQMRSK